MPRQGKVSYEKKLKLVLACISGKMGVREAARIAQVEHSVIQDWVKRYEAEGAEGLLPQTKNRAYSAELKTEAVKVYLSGKGSCKNRGRPSTCTGFSCHLAGEILPPHRRGLPVGC